MKKLYRYNVVWTVITYHVIECGFDKLVSVDETYSFHENVFEGSRHHYLKMKTLELLRGVVCFWFDEIKMSIECSENSQVVQKLNLIFLRNIKLKLTTNKNPAVGNSEEISLKRNILLLTGSTSIHSEIIFTIENNEFFILINEAEISYVGVHLSRKTSPFSNTFVLHDWVSTWIVGNC